MRIRTGGDTVTFSERAIGGGGLEADGVLLPGSAGDAIEGSTASGLGAITKHDAGFDETAFLAYVEQVHFAIADATNSLAADKLRRYVGDGLYTRLSAQIEGWKSSGRRWVQGDATVTHASIRAAHHDANYDTIVVRLATSSTMTEVDASGKVVAGDADQRVARVLDWTFQRSSSATTPAPDGAGGEARCPQCGAPLNLDSGGVCTYCHAPVTSGRYDWVLVRTEAAAGLISPDIAQTVGGLFAAMARGGETLAAVEPAVHVAHTASKVGCLVGAFAGVLGIGAAVVVPIVVSRHNAALVRSLSIGSSSVVAPSRSLGGRITLTGAVRLAPSSLGGKEIALNGAAAGVCPGMTDPVRSIHLQVAFDSGATFDATFTVAPTTATADPAQPGGAAVVHYVGATQATTDDQTWSLPHPPTGGAAVSVVVTSDGAGTLKWESLPAGEPDHNASNPSSGLVTWSCR